MSTTVSVCVFCSSSEAVDGDLRALASELGDAIASRGWRLVYGGGNVGLMGEVARAAMDGGAHVTGVIPHRLVDKEIALDDVSELIRVDTMRERKRLMDERADAFVILPGGIGTLEELMEVLTLKQLGFHDRPIVMLDPVGFWAPLHQLLDEVVAAGLASHRVKELLHLASTVSETLDTVAAGGGERGPADEGAWPGGTVDEPASPQG